jgi:hypothetical protein
MSDQHDVSVKINEQTYGEGGVQTMSPDRTGGV